MLNTITKKSIFFLCLSILLTTQQLHTFSAKKIAGNLCAQLFGKTAASEEIKKRFKDTRKAYGLNPDSQPVRYIENKFFDGLSSFTRFGTWINKNAWQQMSEKEKTFQTFHEVAHEVNNHTPKQISIIASTLLVGVYMAKKYAPILGIMSTIAVLGILVPYMEREFEKNADITAAKKLCQEGKKDIVQNRIANLKQELAAEKEKKQSIFDFSKIWWKPTGEQIRYLEPVAANTDPA